MLANMPSHLCGVSAPDLNPLMVIKTLGLRPIRPADQERHNRLLAASVFAAHRIIRRLFAQGGIISAARCLFLSSDHLILLRYCLLSVESAHLMIFDDSRSPATILVVEDEMMIRMDTVGMVADAGYRSIEAADADRAVAILESRSDIALMVTDVQMPGSMDGLRLAQSVHERWPSIKIIIVSAQLTEPHQLPADSRFLGKPLEARDMILQMQTMIGHA